jgi:hypothetical protein
VSFTNLNSLCANCGYRLGLHSGDVKSKCPTEWFVNQTEGGNNVLFKGSKTFWKDKVRKSVTKLNKSWEDINMQTKIPEKEDLVNAPRHYNQSIETIDYIRCYLGEEGYISYLQGNCIKYLSRCGFKGNKIQDLEKCRFYLERMIKALKKV